MSWKDKVHFFYMKRNDGVITVAYRVARWDALKRNRKVQFSYAACSPKDRFVKSIGREISEGRLRKARPSFTIAYMDDPDKGFYYQAMKHVERAIDASSEALQLPRWLRG